MANLENHPCTFAGCSNNVQYDDEPFCFTHSPDSGSSVRGYSYIKSSVAKNFDIDWSTAEQQAQDEVEAQIIRN